MLFRDNKKPNNQMPSYSIQCHGSELKKDDKNVLDIKA